MRPMLLLVAGLGAACGHRAIIDFSEVRASRRADDRVSVAVEARCRAMLGHAECGALCVSASFVSSTGTLDTVTSCDPRSLGDGATKRFLLVSSSPIPRTPGIRLRVDATSSYIGQWQTLPHETHSP